MQVYWEEGRQMLDVCTSPRFLPSTWPGSRAFTGRQLAQVPADLQLRLNPGSMPTLSLPLRDLRLHAGLPA